MEQLKAKLKKQGGFTMVELLIVVAIIGILAAVSIPMFNNALEKARHGVDAANIRDAVSLATIEVMADLDAKNNFADWQIYNYVVDETTGQNQHQGYLDKTAAGVEPKCTKVNGTSAGLSVRVKYDSTETNVEKKVKVETNWSIGTDGHITVTAFN